MMRYRKPIYKKLDVNEYSMVKKLYIYIIFVLKR